MPPNTKKMVEAALDVLNARKKGGITLAAIKKYILDTYRLERLTSNRVTIIKKTLKTMFEDGSLVTVTGKGMNGHFRQPFGRSRQEQSHLRVVAELETPPNTVEVTVNPAFAPVRSATVSKGCPPYSPITSTAIKPKIRLQRLLLPQPQNKVGKKKTAKGK